LLHVGPTAEMPSLKLPKDTDWTWNRVAKVGEPAEVILQTATELRTDLIIMTTDGPDGFLDALRGTTSEQVLRNPCWAEAKTRPALTIRTSLHGDRS
jgi:hypothetical protein